MDAQLRRCRIKQGMLEQFITEWKAGVVTLREKFGFILIGAWSLPESSELVWVIGYQGTSTKLTVSTTSQRIENG